MRILEDKAYPDLELETRERLSLNRYLEQHPDPQVAFGVKQGRPLTVQDAVTSTLQLESYKIGRPVKISQIGLEEAAATGATRPTDGSAIQMVGRRQEDPTTELLQTLLEKIERLETNQRAETPLRTPGQRYNPRRDQD